MQKEKRKYSKIEMAKGRDPLPPAYARQQTLIMEVGKMKTDYVYITFKTDRETSEILKLLAHYYGKTQPELIEELCKDHIKGVQKYMEEFNRIHEERMKEKQ